jgi:hypothetical protein
MTLTLIADSAIKYSPHPAAMRDIRTDIIFLQNAPTAMNKNPKTYPLSASTNGNDNTPDPIAEAHRAKILPLSEPFSSFPKALLKKSRLPEPGEKGTGPVLILISPVANF